MGRPTLSAVSFVHPSFLEAAQAVRSLQPTHIDKERSFGRGRPNAAPKLGDLHFPRLLRIFDTVVLTGWLNGRTFCAPLLCVDGDATQHHWVHTTEGRVRLSPAGRARLFSNG